MNVRIDAKNISNNDFNETINFGIFTNKFFFLTIYSQNFSKSKFISKKVIEPLNCLLKSASIFHLLIDNYCTSYSNINRNTH
jgi:hypothetical protein